MWFSSWLRKWTSNRTARGRTHHRSVAPRFRPRLEALEDRFLPSTLTVLNTNDSGPGSLRAEIAAAQSGDTIVFDPSLGGSVITLSSGQLMINTSLTIHTDRSVLIDASSSSRVFDVAGSASVTIDNLWILNGSAKDGGAIYNSGTLTLNGCIFQGDAAGDQGGAVYNAGTMVINNTSFGNEIVNVPGPFFSQMFVPNQAVSGGAIENQGTMTVLNSVFAGYFPYVANLASKRGGAIDNAGNLTVSGCYFQGNAAYVIGGITAFAGAGGAIANSGTLNVTASTFVDGRAGQGGAIANFGNAVLDSSTIGGTDFSLACDAAFGGGVFNQGTMTISNSTISGCAADIGIKNGVGQIGGGIYNAGTLNLLQTSVANNVAILYGGGIFNAGSLNMVASTVSANEAEFQAGGIFNAGSLNMVASTVSGNTVEFGTASGIFNSGTLYVTSASSLCGNSSFSGVEVDLFNLGTAQISSDSTVCVTEP
jgi:hypothetical protein